MRMAGSPKKHKPESYTVTDFLAEFPDDESCLNYLWRHLLSEDGSHAHCPKCNRQRRFHRVKSRQSWSCDSCGHHLHPTAGTIFEKTTTPLRLWFHAIFLLSQTRCGISAKQLQRELGVTYKTAWRMFNLIRRLLVDDDRSPLTGEVEIDESAWGGKIRAGDRSRAETSTKRRQEAMAKIKNRPTILAMVERGGRVRAIVVPDRSRATLHSAIRENVSPDATIYTGRVGAIRRPLARLCRPLQDQAPGLRLRRRAHPHPDGRRILRQCQARPLRRPAQRQPQVARELRQRVRVQVQPPGRRRTDVQAVPPEHQEERRRRRPFGFFKCCSSGPRRLATLPRSRRKLGRVYGSASGFPLGFSDLLIYLH